MSNLKFYTEPTFIDNNMGISYGFFTRKGGEKNEIYSGLNCGYGSDDIPENIRKNRRAVANEMNVEQSDLLSLYQIHGGDVIFVNTPWNEEVRPKADAFITDKAGIALGILTADCAPVLFYGQKSSGEPVVGAAHAGWKGSLCGVLENTILEMRRIGATQESIKTCVGPCISKRSYEVSEGFADPFIDENEQSEVFFSAGSNTGHLHFDLSGYCGWRLSRAGIKAVSLMDVDTYKNEDEFFSYRRSTHKKEPDYGRQISVITINA
ncbi:MAG: peptidoglycan editing factor PgeF [Alphaproteobacteria bacterium]